MKLTQRELLRTLLKSLDKIDYIQEDEVPDIALYMDQVTTFMDSRLANATRKPGEDKILTKTMINNYAKNNLLPPSIKKKYSKEHILLMILIFYYKGFLSISDIQSFIGPLGERFFNSESESGYDLSKIYKSIFDLQYGQTEKLVKDVVRSFSKVNDKFLDAPEEDREFLQMFGFICTLSFDVYVKKLLIERIIDMYFKKDEDSEDSKEESEKEEKNKDEKQKNGKSKDEKSKNGKSKEEKSKEDKKSKVVKVKDEKIKDEKIKE